MASMACRKPYAPPAIKSRQSYLVVEGSINSGADTTKIKLSHTVNLSNKTVTNPVTAAIVTVESNAGAGYQLTEVTPGTYIAISLNLDNSRQYRLRIQTADNKQYVSDFVQVIVTPPIDTVGFNVVTKPDTGVQVYVNTHAADNNTRYYRWDYDETWEFHAKYQSDWETNGYEIVPRVISRYICFKSDTSSTVVLGSSAKLLHNVIYQAPVAVISFTSEKIEMDYSILLRQYAITADAYNFWANLKTNTEQLGSIFDAQPSQLVGNIHNVNDASEPVIGYMSACNVTTKRIFITSNQLPYWVPTYPYTCEIDMAHTPGDIAQQIPLGSPIIPLSKGGGTFTYYTCADCTIRGSLKPPSFWK
jgi:hypothetical protein